jgi:hypothetical protein
VRITGVLSTFDIALRAASLALLVLLAAVLLCDFGARAAARLGAALLRPAPRSMQ